MLPFPEQELGMEWLKCDESQLAINLYKTDSHSCADS